MPEPAEKPHFSRGADSNTGTHLLHPLQHRYAPTPPTPTQVRTYSTHSNTGTHLLHPLQHRYAPTPPTPTQVRTYSTHSNTGTHLLHPLQHRYAPTPPTPTQVRTYSTHSNTGTHLLHPLQHRYAPYSTRMLPPYLNAFEQNRRQRCHLLSVLPHSKAALLRNRQQTIHDLFDFFLCVVKKCGHSPLVLKVAGPGVNEYGKAANHLRKKQRTLLEYSSAMKVHDHAQNIAVENEAITEWNFMLG